MKFDLRHLRKLKTEKDFTVLKHPNGHEIKIANKHLSPKMRGELEAVPMAEGGIVDDAPMKSIPYERSNELDKEVANLENTMEKVDPQPVVPAVGAAPVTEPPPQADPFNLPSNQLPSAKSDPYGTQAYLSSYGQGLNEAKQGIEKQAQAETQQSAESVPAFEKQAQQLNQVNQLHQENMNHLNQERQSLMQDAIKGHINPEQYWEEKSLPGKISTIVGLIVGGLGGSDAPVKLIQAQIDRNLQAQKLNLSNKYSLLNANREQFLNERDSMDMTRVMLSDQVSTQLKLAAAKATDPLARARALQAAGQLDMQSAPIISQMALRRSMLGGQQSGQLDPETIIRFSPMIQEGEKEHAFKELEEAQKLNKVRDNLLSSFDQIAKINTVGNRLANPIQAKKQIDAIKASIIPNLSKETAGRYTEQDADTISKLFDTLGANPKSLGVQRTRLEALSKEKMNFPRLKSIGIDLTNSGRFNSQGQSKIQESAPKVK